MKTPLETIKEIANNARKSLPKGHYGDVERGLKEIEGIVSELLKFYKSHN